MNLLKEGKILLKVLIEMVWRLRVRYGGDLGGELLVAESDLFDETIGNAFLSGFSSGFRFFVFILVRADFL